MQSEDELSNLLSSIIRMFLKLFREEAKAFALSEIMPFVQVTLFFTFLFSSLLFCAVLSLIVCFVLLSYSLSFSYVFFLFYSLIFFPTLCV